MSGHGNPRKNLEKVLTALSGPTSAMIRAASEFSSERFDSAVDLIDNVHDGAWTETALLLESAISYGSKVSRWADLEDIDERITTTATRIESLWGGRRSIWPEIIAGSMRRAIAGLEVFEPGGLVDARTWSLHASYLLGHQTTGWAEIDRWRILIEGFDSLGVFDEDGNSLFQGRRYRPDREI